MKRVAVLVGIEAYQDPSFPAARFAESDAAEVASALRRGGGADDIALLTRPTARRLLDTAADTARRLVPGDLFLFWFSGHAVSFDNRGLLVAHDAVARRVSAFQDAVPLDLLLAETAAPGVSRVFILDVGRAAATLPGTLSGIAAAIAETALAVQASDSAPLAMLVCNGGGEIGGVLPGRKQGVFAAALLDEMNAAIRDGRSLTCGDSDLARLSGRLRALGGTADLYLRRRGDLIVFFTPSAAGDTEAIETAPAGTGSRHAVAPRWYRVATEFAERFARQISRRSAFLYGADIEGVDGAALFEIGAVREFEWRAGVPWVVLEWAPLIAMRRPTEIIACLNASAGVAGQHELAYLLNLFFVAGDLARARYELDKVHHRAAWIEPALLLATGFQRPEEGRRYLAECAAWPGRDTRFLVRCARGWHVLFGDLHEAAFCLEAARRRSVDATDYESVAAAVMDIFGDTRTAWSDLGRAEGLAAAARDWVACASGWMRIFGDRRECLRCLEQAGRAATAARDWMAYASGCRELLDDLEATREALAAAEAESGEVWEMQDCAERWLNLCNDEVGAQRCLQRAEEHARHFSEWRDCALAWSRLLKDPQAARRCLLEAERCASDLTHWATCAADWEDLLRDKERAEKCRAQLNRLRARH